MNGSGKAVAFAVGFLYGRVGHRWAVHAFYWAIIAALTFKVRHG